MDDGYMSLRTDDGYGDGLPRDNGRKTNNMFIKHNQKCIVIGTQLPGDVR